MTVAWDGPILARKLAERVPDAVVAATPTAVWVKPEAVNRVARVLRDDPELRFDFLSAVTAVDYIEYFEVLYRLTSLQSRRTAVVKTKVYGRENPSLPTVTDVWTGALNQEREIFDLMGVRFDGHPNMKRVFLWDGFPGHPLRKDFTGPGLPEGVEWARPNV